MAKFLQFAQIFRTTIVDPPFGKSILHPVKVELFSGPRELHVPLFTARISPAGREASLFQDTRLMLRSENTYIGVVARCSDDSTGEARVSGEDATDRTVTTLCLLYTPDIFSELVYKGWLLDDTQIIGDGWARLAAPLTLDFKGLESAWSSVANAQETDPNVRNRFGLMARFFSKALTLNPSEEKLVLLWTVLEIFPMKDTTDIRPISEYLSSIIGQPPDVVKERLGIGRLFGIRSELVHNGILPVAKSDLGEVFGRLENICVEVMRALSGLPYRGTLASYF